MNAYKTAFEGLSKVIKTGTDSELIGLIEGLEQDIAEIAGQQKAKEQATTKSDIMAIKDNIERQQAIKENLNLFQ